MCSFDGVINSDSAARGAAQGVWGLGPLDSVSSSTSLQFLLRTHFEGQNIGYGDRQISFVDTEFLIDLRARYLSGNLLTARELEILQTTAEPGSEYAASNAAGFAGGDNSFFETLDGEHLIVLFQPFKPTFYDELFFDAEAGVVVRKLARDIASPIIQE